MMCRLSLLGQPRLLDDQGKLISVPAKTYALVAYLVLTSRGDPAARATLRQFLWEESDRRTAATNLRKFLSRIVERQEQHGFELIRNRRDHVELAMSSTQIDVAEFVRMATQGTPTDLGALCDLYRGELLEGIEWEGTESQSWLQVQRANLRDMFASAVVGQLEPFDPGANRLHIRVAARRLLEVDPYNEIAHRALMRLYSEEGEPARVREVFAGLEQRLHKDLGVDPDPATVEFFHSLLPARRKAEAAIQEGTETGTTNEEAAATVESDTRSNEASATALSAESGTPRVTVLPPLPIVGQDYSHQLAVSFIEDVTIGLCRSKSLSMVAPHTAREMSQNGRKALLRSLKIDYVVETHLQNRAGELWLAVKLVNAATRNILWVEQYEFEPSQMARRYRELSQRIVLLLVDTIERTELSRYDVEQDPTAYHLFLTGQRFLRTLDLPHIRRARRAFKLAISSCPDFIPAISGLAQTFHFEWLLMARGDNELLEQAERLAERSLEIDPDDARGYRNLGLCRLYSGQFDESLDAFGNAERRNPQHADLLVDFADALQHACEPGSALQKISRAIELNPLCPDDYWWVAGGANFHLQQYGDAIRCMSRMRDQSPAFRLLAASWAMLGENGKAEEYVRRAKDIHPDFSVNNWLSILPIRDPEFARHYEQGLRAAGFN